MTPAGYMAKRVVERPEWLNAVQVKDIFSLSSCCSEDFGDYINNWKHNGYWIFDSPEIIRSVAKENSAQIDGTLLFYYEVYEKEFDGERWNPWSPELSFPTSVEPPAEKRLEGFDVVTFWAKNAPECSPLSCNSMAEVLPTNAHCLLDSFDDAEKSLNNGAFRNCERGPYRIFSVYSVEWT